MSTDRTRNAPQDDEYGFDGPDAFASEDPTAVVPEAVAGEEEAFFSEEEPRGLIHLPQAAPRRRVWVDASVLGVVALLALVVVTRGLRDEPQREEHASISARPVMAQVAPANPPAVVPKGVATTGLRPAAIPTAEAPVHHVDIPAARNSTVAKAVVSALPKVTPRNSDVVPAVMASAPVVEERLPVEEIPSEPEPVPVSEDPAPTATESVAAVAHARDRLATDLVLRAYEDSYNRMDSSSMAQVWPSVDTAALDRAFRTLAQQNLAFEQCDMDFDVRRATARCGGVVRYVQRVGDRTPRVRHMQWTIQMVRFANRWQISGMTVRGAQPALQTTNHDPRMK